MPNLLVGLQNGLKIKVSSCLKAQHSVVVISWGMQMSLHKKLWRMYLQRFRLVEISLLAFFGRIVSSFFLVEMSRENFW